VITWALLAMSLAQSPVARSLRWQELPRFQPIQR